MNAARRDQLLALRDGKQLPPMRLSYSDTMRCRTPVSELVNYVDADGKSCWVGDPWPMILEERRDDH